MIKSTDGDTVIVELGNRSYPIMIDFEVSESVGFMRGQVDSSIKNLIITDRNIFRLHKQKIITMSRYLKVVDIIVLPEGERTKSLYWAQKLYKRFIELHLDRHSILHAVGGGVIGDLTGFVAATFLRGLGYRQYPTTIIAMVDSSVGGKVAVNLAQGKNLIGAFHQPLSVFINTSYLETLPPRQINNGMGEVIKTGILSGDHLFNEIENLHPEAVLNSPGILRSIILECCKFKASIIVQDEKDLGLRRCLNLGHTYAHALESAYCYRGPLHGEAVAMGIWVAIGIAERRGLISSDLSNRIKDLLNRWRLLSFSHHRPDTDTLLSFMNRDKKCENDCMAWVLPIGLGSVSIVHDVVSEEVIEVMRNVPER